MDKAILFCFGENKRQSLHQGSKVNLEGDRYLIDEIVQVSEQDWLKPAEEYGKQQYTLLFEDFAVFKKIADDLEIIYKKGISFRFLNFERLTKETFLPVLEALQFERRFRSKKIKKGLEKKRESGEQLGNPNIADKKGKVQRQRKLKAFKNYHDNSKVLDIIVEKNNNRWSLNRIAEYLNEKNYTTTTGAQYRAKTVQRMMKKEEELKGRFVDLQQELRNKFQPIFKFEDLNDGNYALKTGQQHAKRSEKLSIEGLHTNQSYIKAIEFTIQTPLKEEFEVVILDNDKEDKTPVFSKIYGPNDRQVSIDLDDNILLPGVHYISIATKEERYEPIINRRIRLRMDMAQPIIERNDLDAATLMAQE